MALGVFHFSILLSIGSSGLWYYVEGFMIQSAAQVIDWVARLPVTYIGYDPKSVLFKSPCSSCPNDHLGLSFASNDFMTNTGLFVQYMRCQVG